MIKLAPSILSADFSNLESEVKFLERNGADYLHIDVMDGSFVPNITIGQPVVKALRKISELVFDVHLMVDNPEKHVQSFRDAGADIITIHAEALGLESDTIAKVLRYIRETGAKSAVSIKPKTPAHVLDNVLEYVDMVLIMSVPPGAGGQKFISDVLYKAKYLTSKRKSKCLNFDIEIDGGITLETAIEAIESGVNVLVVGSAIFSAPDRINTMKRFTKLGETY